jgi:phosphohistidine phosphatase
MPAPSQLYVLRHAKSSWDDPGLYDHDRPLAPRGHRAVVALARHVKAGGIQPALVLCSSARRARETLEGLGLDGRISIEPELYAANVDQLLERLWQVPDETGSAMVVGHNPALQILVLRLAASTPDPVGNADLQAVRHKFPTGALATLSFDCPWRQLAVGSAEIVGLVRPKDLH